MKKRALNHIIIRAAFLIAISAGVSAQAGEALIVKSASIAASSDAEHPSAYALDGSLATSWSLAPGAGYGRIELGFAEKRLITGARVSLASGSTALPRFEYKRDGKWFRFFASAEASGQERFVDLSRDRAVTDAVAIVIDGVSADSIGVAELALFGIAPDSLLRRMEPDEVRVSRDNGRMRPIDALLDGNTWTSWGDLPDGMTPDSPGMGGRMRHVRGSVSPIYCDPYRPYARSAEIVFDKERSFEDIGAYFLKSSIGDVEFFAQSGRSWMPLGKIDAEDAPGWTRIAVNGVKTSKILMVLGSRRGRYPAVSELEFWGRGGYEGPETEDIGYPMDVANGETANYEFTLPEKDTGWIEAEIEGILVEAPSAELNGSVLSGSVAALSGDAALVRYAVREDLLWSDANYLRIVPRGSASMSIRNVSYVYDESEGRLPLAGSALVDGIIGLKTRVEDPMEFSFDGTANVRALEVISAAAGTYAVKGKRPDGTWYDLPATGTGAFGIIHAAGADLKSIRFEASGAMAAELIAWGSPTTDGAPSVRFLWPQDSRDPAGDPWSGSRDVHSVTGYVDNPFATVTVNGRQTKRYDHYFWIDADELASPGEALDIVATATDSSGRIGTASLYYIRENPDYLEVAGGDGIIYVDKADYALSGSVRGKAASLFIDGVSVPLVRGNFSYTLALKAGLNLVTLTVKDNRGRTIQTALVRIVYSAKGISIVLLDPRDGAFLSSTRQVLTGEVYGSGVKSVTVNGASATLAGKRWTSRQLSLKDGANTITIKARDALGRTATLIATLTVDTKKPVITVTSPVAGSVVSVSPVPFAGTVQDAGPAWVYVDGQAASVNGGVFTTSIAYPDGTRTSVVKAMDAVGNWSTEVLVGYLLDTVPPEPFQATADPASWTSNTRPAISFQTTDALSGIDHYEAAVDMGGFVRVTSPYAIPAQADGVHIVRVRAFDRGGLYAESLVKVYIDTVAPPAPERALAIPGNGVMTVRWGKPAEDVVSYLITDFGEDLESPADDATSTVEAAERSYTGIENGTLRRYAIVAVDRAGNQSPAAQTEATAGVAESDYNNTDGSVVAYDGVTLIVMPGSLPSEITRIEVTEVESEVMAEKAVYDIISPIYRLSAVLNLDGYESVEENVPFDQEFMCLLEYDESRVPQYFQEQNLGVYYFDTEWSRWFLVPNALVDTANNQIYFKTNHFTSFAVQPTMVEDVDPQALKSVQFSPFASKTTHEGLSISPQGGTVMTEMTEFTLPGPDGFDFTLKRHYDTATERGDYFGRAISASVSLNWPPDGAEILQKLTEGVAQSVIDELEGKLKTIVQSCGDYSYSMGSGWRLNLPYIRSSNSGILLRSPSGSYHSISEMEVKSVIDLGVIRELKMECHEGEDFSFTAIQGRTDVDLSTLIINQSLSIPGWGLVGGYLTLKDGTRYTFDGLGRTTSITSPNGKNSIYITYGGFMGLFLDTITDARGRKIKFTYDWQNIIGPRIKKIFIEDGATTREIVYEHDAYLMTTRLVSATDLAGRKWEYGHSDGIFLFSGGISVKINILSTIVQAIAAFCGDVAGASGQVMSALGLDAVTISGNLKFELFTLVDKVTGPGIGRQAVTHKDELFFAYNVEPADYILWVIPTAIQISGTMDHRMIATSLRVYDSVTGRKIRETTCGFSFSDPIHGQVVISSSTVNDGRMLSTRGYTPYSRNRTRFMSLSDRFLELSGGKIVTSPPTFWVVTPFETISVNTSLETGRL